MSGTAKELPYHDSLLRETIARDCLSNLTPLATVKYAPPDRRKLRSLRHFQCTNIATLHRGKPSKRLCNSQLGL